MLLAHLRGEVVAARLANSAQRQVSRLTAAHSATQSQYTQTEWSVSASGCDSLAAALIEKKRSDMAACSKSSERLLSCEHGSELLQYGPPYFLPSLSKHGAAFQHPFELSGYQLGTLKLTAARVKKFLADPNTWPGIPSKTRHQIPLWKAFGFRMVENIEQCEEFIVYLSDSHNRSQAGREGVRRLKKSNPDMLQLGSDDLPHERHTEVTKRLNRRHQLKAFLRKVKSQKGWQVSFFYAAQVLRDTADTLWDRRAKVYDAPHAKPDMQTEDLFLKVSWDAALRHGRSHVNAMVCPLSLQTFCGMSSLNRKSAVTVSIIQGKESPEMIKTDYGGDRSESLEELAHMVRSDSKAKAEIGVLPMLSQIQLAELSYHCNDFFGFTCGDALLFRAETGVDTNLVVLCTVDGASYFDTRGVGISAVDLPCMCCSVRRDQMFEVEFILEWNVGDDGGWVRQLDAEGKPIVLQWLHTAEQVASSLLPIRMAGFCLIHGRMRIFECQLELTSRALDTLIRKIGKRIKGTPASWLTRFASDLGRLISVPKLTCTLVFAKKGQGQGQFTGDKGFGGTFEVTPRCSATAAGYALASAPCLLKNLCTALRDAGTALHVGDLKDIADFEQTWVLIWDSMVEIDWIATQKPSRYMQFVTEPESGTEPSYLTKKYVVWVQLMKSQSFWRTKTGDCATMHMAWYAHYYAHLERLLRQFAHLPLGFYGLCAQAGESLHTELGQSEAGHSFHGGSQQSLLGLDQRDPIEEVMQHRLRLLEGRLRFEEAVEQSHTSMANRLESAAVTAEWLELAEVDPEVAKELESKRSAAFHRDKRVAEFKQTLIDAGFKLPEPELPKPLSGYEVLEVPMARVHMVRSGCRHSPETQVPTCPHCEWTEPGVTQCGAVGCNKTKASSWRRSPIWDMNARFCVAPFCAGCRGKARARLHAIEIACDTMAPSTKAQLKKSHAVLTQSMAATDTACDTTSGSNSAVVPMPSHTVQ
jgi:hypothetical protein